MALRSVIALGSNLGDRIGMLRRACGEMERDGIRIVRHSRLHWTRPWPPGAAQAPYLNAAVLAESSFGPLELMDRLLEIERRLGRVRRERWGPRVVDLDLIHVEGVRMEHPRLTLPHPRWAERDFVLAPLAELGAVALAGGDGAGESAGSPTARLARMPREQRCILASEAWFPFP